MGLHKNSTGENVHVIHRWMVADEPARLAVTVGTGDVGKVCYQQDNRTWWLLTNHSPVTWTQITDLAFGSEFNLAVSTALSYTTSDTWLEKLKLTLTGLPAGDYVLLWGCDLISGSGGTPSLRIQADDALDLFVSEDFLLPENLKWYPFAGHAAVTGWAGGSHTIDLDYHSNNPQQVGIQNARLTLWRVA